MPPLYLVRAQVMSVKEREYVEAARALGASNLRIFFRHIMPNMMQPLMVQAAIGMGGVILAEATLSFLGLGIPAPAPSWGSMLNDARSHLFDAPHLVLFPAVTVMLAVLAFNFIGDALREAGLRKRRVAKYGGAGLRQQPGKGKQPGGRLLSAIPGQVRQCRGGVGLGQLV